MSEHNYAGLLFKTNLEKYPEVFTINPEKLDKTIAQTIKNTQALHAKNDEATKHLDGPTQRIQPVA